MKYFSLCILYRDVMEETAAPPYQMGGGSINILKGNGGRPIAGHCTVCRERYKHFNMYIYIHIYYIYVYTYICM